MSVTLQHLAELVGGTLEGDGATAIEAARPITAARQGDISFIESPQHAHLLGQCQATALVVPLTLQTPGRQVVRVANPLKAFIAIVQALHGKAKCLPFGIDPRAAVHPSAKVGAGTSIYALAYVGENTVIGERCWIHPGVVIGANCRIGDDVTLYANAVIYDETTIGNRTIIHGSAVVGADGFGYRTQDGKHVKVPQLSHVEIGDDVEIGAGTTIDRGTFQPTRIGSGTKIDNLVQVAHNVAIGQHNLIVGQVGMSGSCSTGNYVVIAGQAGVSEHVHIGDGTIVGGGSAVVRDVPANQRVLGQPAMPEKTAKRMYLTLDKLPEMRRDLENIKRKLNLTAPTPELKDAG